MMERGESIRLFQPPRLKKFCPGQHCAKACDAGSCTCAPCFSSCEFCRARKRNNRGQIVQQIAASPNRQLHLPTGRAWK